MIVPEAAEKEMVVYTRPCPAHNRRKRFLKYDFQTLQLFFWIETRINLILKHFNL